MIRKTINFILLACVILVVILSIRETILNNPYFILRKLSKEEGGIFSEGKELIFLVKYMGIIPVGIAKMKVEGVTIYNGKNVYKLLAQAEILKPISIFYKAKARIESYMDKKRLHSLQYIENLYLPHKDVKTKKIVYDQDKLIMRRENMKRRIPANTQDSLSSIFYLRTLDFKLNKTFTINLISKQEIYELKAEALKKDRGIWMIKATVARKDRSSSHGINFLIWLSDDARRLPLLFKSWTPAGLVIMRLIK